MKTHSRILRLSRSVGFQLLSSIAAAMAAAASAGAATAPMQGEPKAYTLFMGADVSVSVRNEVCPVCDVSGSAFVVKEGGQPVVVSPGDGSVALKITPGLKITESSAVISGLKAEASYSPGSDPYTKFTKQTNQAASDYAQSQFAANYGNALMIMANSQASNAVGPGGAPLVAGQSPSAGASGGANGSLAALTAASRVAYAQTSLNDVSQISNSANAAAQSAPGPVYGSGTHPDAEMFDAISVSFEVSAAKPLEHPYVMLIGKYRERSGPAGALRTWVYAEALGRIDSKTSKVRIYRGGFPPGFEMRAFQVHLYNDGQEVATNVAANRVELTRDEAFEYVKMEYIGSHKGATLPAVPAMGRLPADLHSRLAGGQYVQAIFVRVSKDGVAAEAFSDEACTRRLDDPYLDSVVRQILFKPALEDGKPVAGVAKLMLGQLIF
jgi:hypothetical protein